MTDPSDEHNALLRDTKPCIPMGKTSLTSVPGGGSVADLQYYLPPSYHPSPSAYSLNQLNQTATDLVPPPASAQSGGIFGPGSYASMAMLSAQNSGRYLQPQSPFQPPASQRGQLAATGPYWQASVSESLSSYAGYQPTAAVPTQGYPSPFSPWPSRRAIVDGDYERTAQSLGTLSSYIPNELRGWTTNYPGAAVQSAYGNTQGFQYPVTGKQLMHVLL